MAMKMLINSREVSDRPIHDRDDDDRDQGAVSQWVGGRIKNVPITIVILIRSSRSFVIITQSEG